MCADKCVCLMGEGSVWQATCGGGTNTSLSHTMVSCLLSFVLSLPKRSLCQVSPHHLPALWLQCKRVILVWMRDSCRFPRTYAVNLSNGLLGLPDLLAFSVCSAVDVELEPA